MALFQQPLRIMNIAIWVLAMVSLSSCSWLVSSESTDSNVQASKDIEVIWSVDVDGRKPADPLAYANATVTGKGIDAKVVIGGRDGRAHVYDISGSELYRVTLLEGVDSGAATLASGLVVLSDTGGQLYAIDAVQGKIAWQFTLSSPVTGTPVVVGQDVLVQCADNRIYRINEHGEKLWSFSAQAGGLGLYLNASPLLHDNRVYALLTTGDAVALDVNTGDLLWRKQLLLNTDAAHLADLKAPQAIPVWLPDMTWDANTANNAVLFSFYQGDVFVVGAEGGNTLLTHTISFKSAPLLADKRLYAADSHGFFQAIERSTGMQIWKKKLSDGELVGPVMWHGSFWLADSQGSVFRVDSEGHVQATIQLPGAIDRSPMVMDDGLLLHSSFGGLYLVH